MSLSLAKIRGASILALIGLSVLAVSARVEAHGSQKFTVARIVEPVGPETVVDEQVVVRWLDNDKPTRTGTASVEIGFVRERPPSFEYERSPELIPGGTIIGRVLETDPENTVVWDTSGLPAGVYHLYSRVLEPEGEVGSIEVFDFGPSAVVVAHPGDPVSPALVVVDPDSPFRNVDESVALRYSAFDPDGSATVSMEARYNLEGTEFVPIADDLPAVFNGIVEWDTSELRQGQWIIRARIEDARGLSFDTWARFPLTVVHRSGEPDAGPSSEAGLPSEVLPEEGGCRCAREASRPSGFSLLFMALACALIARRRADISPFKTARDRGAPRIQT